MKSFYQVPYWLELFIDVSKKKHGVIQLTILSICCGLIIWHTVLWNNNGTHEAMIAWTGSVKAFQAVFYNLALMLITGVLLGAWMNKITEFTSYFLNKK